MSAGFQCKKFYVAHDRCAMKVGTDGLLLGAWAPMPTGGTILDIGAGSGLISLMLAQRSQGKIAITAIELDDSAAAQAADNVALSPWPDSIRLIRGDILTYQPAERYRLIVSNPPFFQQSLAARDAKRQQARHTDSLPFAALLQKAASLLDDAGCFALILPHSSAPGFIAVAQQLGWQLQAQCTVLSKANRPQRSLLTLVRQSTNQLAVPAVSETQLLIHAADGSYSADYQQLLAAFYLKFTETVTAQL